MNFVGSVLVSVVIGITGVSFVFTGSVIHGTIFVVLVALKLISH